MTEVLIRPGQVLDERFEIDEEVGRGGMATVYRARDVRHGREVAVKVLHPELCHALASDRFLREIRIEAGLHHPHIIAMHDSGHVSGCPYYVMPFVQGESLRSRLDREGPLPVAEAIRITREVASALAYAHAHGVVHRDVKPQNILLSSGQALLADFGIARAVMDVGGAELTEKGIAVGTPWYMSPEQAGGDRDVDARSDMYSLACVLYEMLAGEPPFTGRTTQAILARHMLERVPSLQVVRPGVAPAVTRAIEKALEKSPADRFGSIDELVHALDKAVAEPDRRGHRREVAAGLVVIAALATFAWLWPPRMDLDRRKVVVFPLEERGLPPTMVGAGTDVALMIAAALEHADPLRPVDVRDRLSPELRTDAGLLTADLRRSLASARGAGHYIAGIVQARPDSTSVTLRLFDVEGDSVVAARTVTGPRSLGGLHRLGIDATKLLIPSLIDPGREVDLAPLRERDAGAIALFLQGERAYRLSSFEPALALYERALRSDSALALAAIKGAQAASWIQNDARSAELVRLAISRDSLLPPRYAAFARGLEAFLAGRADTALAWISRALVLAPNWSEALMVQGEIQYHLVPLRARLDSMATTAFEAAVTADSGFTPPLFHLSEIAIRDGDLARARHLMQTLARQGPSPWLVGPLRLMLECVEREDEPFNWSEAAHATPRDVLAAAKALSVAGRQLRCADGAFRALLSSDSSGYHWSAFLGLHAVLAATGDHRAVAALGDSLATAGTLRQAMMLYPIDVIAGLPLRDNVAATIAFAQERWGNDYTGLRARPELAWLQWLFGVWHATQRQESMVRSLHAALDSSARSLGTDDLRLYASALDAQLALLRGDTTVAIERLQALSPVVSGVDLEWEVDLSLGVERMLLAELLLARGRHEEAHDVATTFDHSGPVIYLVFLPRSLVVRHQSAVALGRRSAADGYRARLAALGRADLVETLD